MREKVKRDRWIKVSRYRLTVSERPAGRTAEHPPLCEHSSLSRDAVKLRFFFTIPIVVRTIYEIGTANQIGTICTPGGITFGDL